MENYYEINVSLNGIHLFATAPRSAKTKAEVDRIMKVFIKKFSKEEGFKIFVERWRCSGEFIDWEGDDK